VDSSEIVLAELVSRVLDRGVVVAGDVTISVAGVDLIHLGLTLRLASSETLIRRGHQSSRPSLPSPGSRESTEKDR
jgi:hypothetical protein